jgi:SAM-dependent methyltransferase
MPFDHVQSTKEVIRHTLHIMGLSRALHVLRRQRGFQTEHLKGATTRARFQTIYRTGAWVHAVDQQARSGVGSETSATASIRTCLPPLLEKLGTKRLLDVGCGDWTWMRQTSLPCDYIGIDVVPEVVEANRVFQAPGVSFAELDAITDPLPQADTILCREVLFHLSLSDAQTVLAKTRRAARWLIATTDTRIWFNSDIPTGDFRIINLQRAPFLLPPPDLAICDEAISPGRLLAVWSCAG